MKREIFTTFEPRNELLKKHIKTYYFHKCPAENFRQRIIYYPNFTATLNIYKNSKVEWSEFSRTHYFSENEKPVSLLVSKFDRAREINIRGPLDKLTIVFHPLGLNHFIPFPFSKIVQVHFSFFKIWGKEYDELIEKLFSENDINSKRELLDNFFLKKYTPLNDDRIKKAVGYILKSDEQIRVNQLAEKIGISRKTLLRLFRKHLAYSVEEYLSVVRFRKALINYQNKIAKPSLTDLAYESGYYDQPDFNHQFKIKTGMTPRQLFSELETVTKGLFWNIS